jgi:hypothetical protein
MRLFAHFLELERSIGGFHPLANGGGNQSGSDQTQQSFNVSNIIFDVANILLLQ